MLRQTMTLLTSKMYRWENGRRSNLNKLQIVSTLTFLYINKFMVHLTQNTVIDVGGERVRKTVVCFQFMAA